MSHERRFLSNLVGRLESTTRFSFCGVFTLDTLHLAMNMSDLNRPNLFYINLENRFIAIYNTPTKCFVVDGFAMNRYPDSVREFVDELRGGVPVEKLSFNVIDRKASLMFCVLMTVSLTSSHSSLHNIISQFKFQKNSLTHNNHIVNAWFTNRYQI